MQGLLVRVALAVSLLVPVGMAAPSAAGAVQAASVPVVERVAGVTRYEAAIADALMGWPTTDNVVFVSGLAEEHEIYLAQPLAGVQQAPVLMIPPTSVPSSVLAYLADAGVKHATVIGDSDEVNDSVLATLDAALSENDPAATVTRISPSSAEGLSAAVTDVVVGSPGYVAGRAVVIPFSEGQPTYAARAAFAAAAPVCYANRWPLVVSDGASLGEAALSALDAAGCTTVTVVAGPLLRSGLLDDLEAAGFATDVVSGPGPDGTTAAFAQWAYDGGFAETGEIGIATYGHYIESAGAMSLMGLRRGVMLGTESNLLPPYTQQFLFDRSVETSRVTIFGGSGAISSWVQSRIQQWAPVTDWNTISGTVTDRSGTPIEGAGVWVHGTDAAGTWLMGFTLTGSDGTWSVDRLHTYGRTPATFSVIADAEGYIAQSWKQGPAWAFAGDAVRLNPGESKSGVTVSLATPAQWSASRVKRVAGTDRYSTAIELSKQNFADAQTVVIATGDSFADALAASPLCAAHGAPLLLTRRDTLPAGLIDEIKRLGATKMFIVGGSGAVSTAVENALKAQGITLVARLQGSDRYETSYRICDRVMNDTRQLGYDAIPIVVRGDGFADALAFSPYAYQMRSPILLVKPGDATAATKRAFAEQRFTLIIAAGPVANDRAVLGQLAGQLDPIYGDLYYIPIAGTNRYQTAALAAEWWGMPMPFVGVTTGLNFPDALAGGVVCGARRGALLLTPPTSLATDARDVVVASQDALWQAQIFGGAGSVGTAVEAALLQAIPPITSSQPRASMVPPLRAGSSLLGGGVPSGMAGQGVTEPFAAAPRLRAARP